MNWLNTVLIVLAAILVVFWQAAFPAVRNLLGAQIDLLPALMVYTALRNHIASVALLALLGGLAFDSLSANNLGVSVLPLFLIGLAINLKRDVILRDQTFAQFILGCSASLIVPVLTLLLMLTCGQSPLLGWGTLWQLLIMGLGGGGATPVLFELFGWLDRTLVHGKTIETSFRPDREIRRGR